MNVLFTGRGTSGSWKVRGEQLGGAVGRAKPRATIKDMRAADAVVLVKRPAAGMLADLRASGTPWVWDLVDFYPQPECTAWSRRAACEWVRRQIRKARPNAIIWPNARMAEDCGGNQRDLVLYHHHRPGIDLNPVRERIQVVGYEGAAQYLGCWERQLRTLCQARGWELQINTGSHADWDVCVAFRDPAYDGYAQRSWKSNVKLANCHGSGTPFIGARENGYIETAACGEAYCNSVDELSDAFDALESQRRRQIIAANFRRVAYPLEAAASDLRAWLDRL